MAIEIRLAQTSEDLEAIFRFRYRISMEDPEYPQSSTDHRKRWVTDPMDCTAKIIGAFEHGIVVGTVRTNYARSSDLITLAGWLGLERAGKFHPYSTSITTKLMIDRRLRGGTVAVRLAREAFRMGAAEGIRFDFIYCKPQMIKFFLGLGYRQYQGEIAHALYGQVTPMVLSLSDVQHQRIRSPLTKQFDPRGHRQRLREFAHSGI